MGRWLRYDVSGDIPSGGCARLSTARSRRPSWLASLFRRHVPLPVRCSRVTQKRRLALASIPFDFPFHPLAPLGSPRLRRPPAGLEMRKKATDRSSGVKVATTKLPKPPAMLTMSAHLNLWTSNLVGGRGATPPGGGSRRGHPGAAWEQLKCPRRDGWKAHNNCLNLL